MAALDEERALEQPPRHLALGHFDRVIGLRAGAVVLDAPAERVDPAELARLFDLGAAGA